MDGKRHVWGQSGARSSYPGFLIIQGESYNSHLSLFTAVYHGATVSFGISSMLT